MNIVFIILLILLCLCIVTLFFCFYLLYRNKKVRDFRSSLIDMAYEYEIRRLRESGKRTEDEKDAFSWFSDKYSYEEYLFSLKPLKLKYWYTEEELKEINR